MALNLRLPVQEGRVEALLTTYNEENEIEREINVSFGLCIRPVIKER